MNGQLLCSGQHVLRIHFQLFQQSLPLQHRNIFTCIHLCTHTISPTSAWSRKQLHTWNLTYFWKGAEKQPHALNPSQFWAVQENSCTHKISPGSGWSKQTTVHTKYQPVLAGGGKWLHTQIWTLILTFLGVTRKPLYTHTHISPTSGDGAGKQPHPQNLSQFWLKPAWASYRGRRNKSKKKRRRRKKEMWRLTYLKLQEGQVEKHVQVLQAKPVPHGRLGIPHLTRPLWSVKSNSNNIAQSCSFPVYQHKNQCQKHSHPLLTGLK